MSRFEYVSGIVAALTITGVVYWLFGAAHAIHVFVALLALLDSLWRGRR